MTAQAELDTLIRPVVEGLSIELVGLVYIPQNRRACVRLYIDTPSGVTCDDCARVSKAVARTLEDSWSSEPSGGYTLEVSSPGLDRQLFTLEQLKKQAGKVVKIKLKVPRGVEGRRQYTGVLTQVSGTEVTLLSEEVSHVFEFEEIEKAKLVPTIG